MPRSVTFNSLLGLLLQPERQRTDTARVGCIEALNVTPQRSVLLLRHIARREPFREAHILR
jgi:hypothetical protein